MNLKDWVGDMHRFQERERIIWLHRLLPQYQEDDVNIISTATAGPLLLVSVFKFSFPKELLSLCAFEIENKPFD